MFSTRSFAIAIFLPMLSVVPSICAQDVKPPEKREFLDQLLVIRRPEPHPLPVLGFSLQPDSVPAPSIKARDLSKYRAFQFGMTLLAVAKQADLKPSAARVIHQRPAVIQQLDWWPERSLGASPQSDSVNRVIFNFYNGELFRMVVHYDQDRTVGLTEEDMVEALSAEYGTATRPAAETIRFSSVHVYNDTERVIARWEDPHYSFNLFHFSYLPTYGMLVFSKRLDALARTAIVEAIRLDEQEGPQREVEHQRKHDEEKRAEQAKARLVNKPAFRP